MNRNKITLTGGMLLIVLLAACLPFGWQTDAPPGAPPTVSTGFIHTAAAATVSAQMTQAAGETAVAQLTEIAAAPSRTSAPPTDLPPTQTPWPSPVSPPSATPPPPPSLTPLPSPTAPPPTPWPTWTPGWQPSPTPVTACNKAQFVQDITVPDGTVLPAGAAFRKTWRLLNVGSCTWTENYGLVFFSGDRLHVRPGYRLNRVVRPGDAVDVSADFVAPATPGRYRGNWMLIDASGVRFGIGPYGNNPFWVDIRVTPLVDGRGFDFAANMCGALWTNGRDTLPCPGNPGADSGSVSLLINPMFEGGRRENEPTLWTRPQSSRGGVIAGLFPAYKVRSGDRFLASIGCLQNSKGCDVTFYLDYKIAGQPRGNLGVWQEVYDGRFSEVEVDLSALAGQEVQFILQVVNNGKPAAANAFWFTPFILRAN